MKHSHFWANHVLSFFSRLIFRHDIRDSQSGMWIFHRQVWAGVDVRSPGMAFSQEIKNAAVLAGYKVTETHIEYRVRGGDVKLNSVRDGVRNLAHLIGHRIRHDGPASGGSYLDQDALVRTGVKQRPVPGDAFGERVRGRRSNTGMPDRQRHGRLSEGLARLFAARSRKSPCRCSGLRRTWQLRARQPRTVFPRSAIR